MKPVFALLLLLFALGSKAQPNYYYLTFDTITTGLQYSVQLDPNDQINPWQTGTPIKTVFTAGYGGIRAIMTDTASPVAPNDTSMFILQVPHWSAGCVLSDFSFWHMLDIDTGDIAVVESNSTGVWQTRKKFQSAATGWQKDSFFLNWSGLRNPTQLRFTFIAGNSSKVCDGWMMDSLTVIYALCSDVKDIKNDMHITIHPNPVTDVVNISCGKALQRPATMELINTFGQKLISIPMAAGANKITLDVRDLPNGVYICMIRSGDHSVLKRLNIAH